MDARECISDIIYLDRIAVISIALSDPTLAFAGGANCDHPFMKISSYRTVRRLINSILVAGTGLIIVGQISIIRNRNLQRSDCRACIYRNSEEHESRDLYVKFPKPSKGENKRLSDL